MVRLACLLLLCVAGLRDRPVHAASPASELQAALADLERVAAVDPLRAQQLRYLSAYNTPAEQLGELQAALRLVLNAVSRAELMADVERITPTLWRVDLERVALPAATWEALVARDPYWHLTTEVVDPTRGQPTRAVTDGGWLDLGAAARLRGLSGSGGALLRADQFVVLASQPPHYYDLAGVPERESDFFALLGVDRATIERLLAHEGANTLRSNVTRQVRRTVRWQGPLGALWTTYDVASSTPERDPFRNPFGFVYDAGEHIATKPNGLHLFALYDARGQRADSVPDTLAKDTSDPAGPGIVVPLLSCVRCHVEDGLRPFANDQRRLLASGVDLSIDNPQSARRAAAFYASPTAERNLARDREDYAHAVRQATGLSVPDAAAALAAVVRRYEYHLVTPAQGCAELGLQVPAGRDAADVLRPLVAGVLDPVVLALGAGIDVQREQWEAAYAAAAVAVRRPPQVAAEPPKTGLLGDADGKRGP